MNRKVTSKHSMVIKPKIWLNLYVGKNRIVAYLFLHLRQIYPKIRVAEKGREGKSRLYKTLAEQIGTYRQYNL